MQHQPQTDLESVVISNRVAAVVVTRNRLPLLRRCVEALEAQTRPLEAIFVVDVASTDETPAFLASRARLVQVVRLETNAGGAGGFHAGIEAAHQAGFDWVWCMDDDGFASPGALGKLFEARDNPEAPIGVQSAGWLNSIVVQIDNPEELAFDFPVGSGFEPRTTAQLQAQGKYVPDCCPFNGTLIHQSVIASIGTPNPAFFIWGDEQEYKRRAVAAGTGVFTITDSLFYHPASNAPILPSVPIRSFWKHFYHVRNHGASATKDGQVRLSAGSSYKLGRFYLKALIISILSNSLKILIVLAAMLAALANNTRRFYPK